MRKPWGQRDVGDHLREDPEECGVEQLLLALEVHVDRALVRLGRRGDPVDPGTGQPVGGELLDGGLEDPGAGGFGVAGHVPYKVTSWFGGMLRF
jgi:hypothetical protein